MAAEIKDWNAKLDAELGRANLEANMSILTSEEKKLVQLLVEAGQVHVFAPWPAPGTRDADKKRLLAQVAELERVYPGGLKAYVTRAKDLLEKSRIGANPYEGFRVSEPKDAVRLSSPEDFKRWEARGMPEVKDAAFVLVAGGLGERLGYQGIKVALPAEVTTGKPFLQLYAEFILALQDRARKVDPNAVLPLGIMTSDDTDALTRQLLERHKYFGLARDQVVIFKQGKVPALLDNDAHFALDPKDPFQIESKPHGHGDVHTLLYQHRIVDKWVREMHKRWVVFFQDTNALVFRAVPAALGVSAENKLHVNSITVPRVQGDAVGAICRLERVEGKTGDEELPNPLTINVEYNQLEGLLGKGVKEPLVPGTNFSIYPGNINVLIFEAPHYLSVLEKKKGTISEFVNPKYKPGTNNTVFNKPTRLECMMQDYPKLLDKTARVSFTQFDRWTAFSPVKNNLADAAAKQKNGNAPESASSGEADVYEWARIIMRQAGIPIPPGEEKDYAGVRVREGPHIVFAPAFGVTQDEVLSKLRGKDKIKISPRSTLVIEGEDVVLESLDLDGALVIRASPGAKVVVKNLTIKNDGWQFVPVKPGDDPKYAIRGYRPEKKATAEFVFEAGAHELSDATKDAHAAAFEQWRAKQAQ